MIFHYFLLPGHILTNGTRTQWQNSFKIILEDFFVHQRPYISHITTVDEDDKTTYSCQLEAWCPSHHKRAVDLKGTDGWKLFTIIILLAFFGTLLFALAFCTSLLLDNKYLRAFDVICVDYLRCAKKECECSYQNAKNGILNGLFLH